MGQDRVHLDSQRHDRQPTGASCVRRDHQHRPDQGHDHVHAQGTHSHRHAHGRGDYDQAFAIGIALNLGFVAIEAGFGLLANSLALLADAGHNLSDVLGLLLAWGAAWMTRRQPTSRHTYGFGSSSILASLTNAVILLVVIGAIGWEALGRLLHPQPVADAIVMWVAAVGIAINAATAWLFFGGRKNDLNIRGAYLHMAADAAVSAGVLAAALVIRWTGWFWLDPLTSLAITAVIILGTWSLLKESMCLAMAGVPAGIERADVEGFLAELPGVTAIHDLHIWALSTTETALTAHLVRPGGGPDDQFLKEVAEVLQARFRIGHCTIQVEHEGDDCALAPAEVV
jgi:cobalt-zinc-cadmium efflux system protein